MNTQPANQKPTGALQMTGQAAANIAALPTYSAPGSPGTAPIAATAQAGRMANDSTGKGGTPPPVDTSQPSPATVNATPYTVKAGDTLSGISATQGMPMADILKNNPTITDPNKIGTGMALNLGQQSPYKQGFNTAMASGTPPPQDGSPLGNTQMHLPATPPDTMGIDAQLAEDKGYQQLLQDRKDYTDTANQQKSLLDFYKQSISEAGIPSINEELLNTKKVIDGTEDDIRSEVQAANGFATNSQVLALASARNKTLIQNYNNLLDTKNMAMESIKTMVGLAQQDQQAALQQVTQKMGLDEQLNSYRDKFVNNAQEGYKTLISTVGISGLYNGLMNTDPTGASLSKVSQILGITPEEMKTAALQDTKNKNLDQTSKNLDIQSKQLEIKKTQQELNDTSGLPSPAKAGKPGYNDTGVKYTTTNAQNEITALWKAQGALDKNTHIPPTFYNQAKAWWAEQGLKDTDFDNILGQYKQQGLKGYN